MPRFIYAIDICHYAEMPDRLSLRRCFHYAFHYATLDVDTLITYFITNTLLTAIHYYAFIVSFFHYHCFWLIESHYAIIIYH